MNFADIVAGGEPLLERLLAEGAQETLQLDFKEPGMGTQAAMFTADGSLTKSGRKVVAKALSAFSNSAGGVLVLGVECRSVDGVDCVQSLQPVPNWQAALSRLNSAVSDLLQPKNDGVKVAGFPSTKDAQAGYIIIDVPRSERRPHRSEGPDEKQYFKRSGTSSIAMEHYDIEDAFRRVGAPELTLNWQVRPGSQLGVDAEVQIPIILTNVGNSTAKLINLLVTPQPGIRFRFQPRYSQSISYENLDISTRIFALPDFVIHPNETRTLAVFACDLSIRGDVLTVDGRDPAEARLAFAYLIGAENMRGRVGEVTIDGSILGTNLPENWSQFA